MVQKMAVRMRLSIPIASLAGGYLIKTLSLPVRRTLYTVGLNVLELPEEPRASMISAADINCRRNSSRGRAQCTGV